MEVLVLLSLQVAYYYYLFCATAHDMVGYLLLCFFIKSGSMIEKLGELLGPKYSSMEHGVSSVSWPKLKSAA